MDLFYSQLRRALSEAPAKVFTTGPQVAAWLSANAGRNQIKKDEIFWCGIVDWLESRDKVSKEEVLGFLDEKGVRVTEVILGGDGESPDTIAARENIAVVRGPNGEYDVWHDDAYIGQYETEAIATRERDAYIAENYPAADVNAPKYTKWQLPGGDSYRELLLTVPKRNKGFKDWYQTKYGMRPQFDEDSAPKHMRLQFFDETGTDDKEFRSRHFEYITNIVAHVRFNERTDAQGNSVLFLEELQSDWGQKGKRGGFAGDPLTESEQAEYDRLIEEGRRNLPPAEAARLTELSDKRSRAGGVPSAPFVTDTKAWTALALKRMIRYAAENGFDKVAWTTGEQQAARYDLSKQVQSVSAERMNRGLFALTVMSSTGEKMIKGKFVPEAKLADYVGKDLSEKIIGDNGGTYTGIDLRVGGDGMKGYYDEIIPQVANEILKRAGGGKVECGNLSRLEHGEIKPDVEECGVQQYFCITPELRAKVLNEGLPLFSICETAVERPLSTEAIEAEVWRLRGEWKRMPHVSVVESVDKLSFAVPEGTDGVYHAGKVYVIGGRIGSQRQLQKVLAHECVLHHSLLDMLGSDGFARLHNQVQDLKSKGHGEVRKLADEVFARHGRLSPEEETKEIIALAGERCLDAAGDIKVEYGFMKSVYAAVADWLREQGCTVPFSNIELHGIIHDAGQWIRQDLEKDGAAAPVVCDGIYCGKVIDVKDGCVFQKVGREAESVAIHDVARLSRVPAIGEVTDIRYRNGRGRVAGPLLEWARER